MSLLAESLTPLFQVPVPQQIPQTWGEMLVDVLHIGFDEAEEWLTDQYLPRPEYLHMIVDFLEMTPQCSHRELLDLLDRQLVEVAGAYEYKDEQGVVQRALATNPRQRMTLGSYMLGPMRDRLAQRLGRVDWREQLSLIYETEKIVDRVRHRPEDPGS